jgi:hypothetical protein
VWVTVTLELGSFRQHEGACLIWYIKEMDGDELLWRCGYGPTSLQSQPGLMMCGRCRISHCHDEWRTSMTCRPHHLQRNLSWGVFPWFVLCCHYDSIGVGGNQTLEGDKKRKRKKTRTASLVPTEDWNVQCSQTMGSHEKRDPKNRSYRWCMIWGFIEQSSEGYNRVEPW